MSEDQKPKVGYEYMKQPEWVAQLSKEMAENIARATDQGAHIMLGMLKRDIENLPENSDISEAKLIIARYIEIINHRLNEK